jgi:peroxiredoxin
MASDISAQEKFPPPKELLEDLLTKYAGAQALKFRIKTVITMASYGIENNMTNSYDFTFRSGENEAYALLNRTGIIAKSEVYDGKNLIRYSSSLKKYSRDAVDMEDPTKHLRFNASELHFLGTENFLFPVFLSTGAFYSAFGGAVQNSRVIGEEILFSKPAFVLELSSSSYSMRIWVDQESRLPLKALIDIEYHPEVMMADYSGPEDGNIADIPRIRYSEEYRELDYDLILDDSVFEFSSAADYRKVSSIYEENSDSAKLGLGSFHKYFSLYSPNAERDISSDEFSETTVLLIFANGLDENTKKLLKKITELAGEDSLGIYAVISSCSEKELKKAARKLEIEYPLLCDSGGDTGRDYDVEISPTMFIIDRKGKVKHIYTGFYPGLKETIADDLSILLSSADISYGKKNSIYVKGLRLAWNVPLKSASFDIGERIYSCAPSGDLYHLSYNGSIDRIVKLRTPGVTIMSCDRYEGFPGDYLSYRKHGNLIRHINLDTDIIWEYRSRFSISCAQILSDETNTYVALGTYGPEGIILLSAEDGSQAAVSTEAVNITMIRQSLSGDQGKQGFSALSGDGNIYSLDFDGTVTGKIRPAGLTGYYMVFDSGGSEKETLISGSSGDNEILMKLGDSGELEWEIILGDAQNSSVTSITKNPFKELYACATMDGQVLIINDDGEVFAEAEGNGISTSTGWIEDSSGTQLLLTANIENGINAYSISSEK